MIKYVLLLFDCYLLFCRLWTADCGLISYDVCKPSGSLNCLAAINKYNESDRFLPQDQKGKLGLRFYFI